MVNALTGLFCCTCLPFGVASTPALFQHHMETILQGLPGVQVAGWCNYCGKTQWCQCMMSCQWCGYSVSSGYDWIERNQFQQEEVEFLGHKISKKGQQQRENLEAILKVEAPRGVSKLRMFLGIVTYYQNFYLMCPRCWPRVIFCFYISSLLFPYQGTCVPGVFIAVTPFALSHSSLPPWWWAHINMLLFRNKCFSCLLHLTCCP